MTRSKVSRRQFLRNAAIASAVLSQSAQFKALGESDSTAPSPAEKHFLFFDQPAATWPDALPVGNGRLGAVVFGSTSKERLQLNEETVWIGEVRDRNNPQASHTPEVRKLLMEGKVHEAEALAAKVMMGVPSRMPCYQTLGDLWMEFDNVPTEVSNYRLELDLDDAICRTSFTIGTHRWTREVFCSAPQNVIVARLESTQPMSFTVKLDRPASSETIANSNSGLVMTGKALPAAETDSEEKERAVGVSFRAELKVSTEDGTVRTHQNTLRVENAHKVTLLITASTDFRAQDAAGMTAACMRALTSAMAMPYSKLRAEHIADYQKYARRAEVHLHSGPDPLRNMPTDKRICRVKDGAEDTGLIETYFRYGRYMLISSSRPGTLPANLQGIWNDSLNPPWGSKFTININAQMNYWLAETCNLADLHPQLFELLDRTRTLGIETARKYYNARGWVAHHNTDIWGDTIPVDRVQAGVWPLGAAWLALHLWDHYAFGGDKAFLRERAYPRLREIAEFFLDYLVEAPDGTLLSGPSQSPENKYVLPDGTKASLCMSPAMDTQIIRAVFNRVDQCCGILDTDPKLHVQVLAALKRLQPFRIGKNGTLQEWNEDYGETEPGHRHISHLFALYPDNQITPRSTAKLADATRATLQRRLEHGGGSTGWSRTWTINCWARLEDGEAAYQSVLELLRHSTRGNLFDVCGIKENSPFQIDGNLGGTAALAEMLLQSHEDVIRLLPALPKAWATGRFRGLRARGGVEVDCDWHDGRVVAATLKPSLLREITIATPDRQRISSITTNGHKVTINSTRETGEVALTLQPGKSYRVVFA